MGEKTSKALRLPLLQGRYKMDPVLHQRGAGLLCHNCAARPQGRVPATGQPEAEVTWQHGGGGQPRGPLGHRATAWAPAWEVPSWGALGGPGANGRGGLGRGSRAAERKGVLTQCWCRAPESSALTLGACGLFGGLVTVVGTQWLKKGILRVCLTQFVVVMAKQHWGLWHCLSIGQNHWNTGFWKTWESLPEI